MRVQFVFSELPKQDLSHLNLLLIFYTKFMLPPFVCIRSNMISGFILAGLRYSSSISRWVWTAFLLFGLLSETYGFLEGTRHLLKLPICTGNYKSIISNICRSI